MGKKRRTKQSHDYADKARGKRLQKVLAEAGVGSRRHCEDLIEAGEVTVNKQAVTDLPAWVDAENDRIVVAGKVLKVQKDHKYIMLFKPRGVVSTNADPQGRTIAIDLVRHPSKVRLFPVGRLDVDSSGLLLLTNDGELANKLTHPRYGIHKTYEVTVKGSLNTEEVAKLERGIFLYDKRQNKASRTKTVKLKLQKRDRDKTRMLMELREGRNRQIRRMMLHLNHPVKKLRRVMLGPLKLKGLAVGEWRELTAVELRSLRKAAATGKHAKKKTAGKKKKKTTSKKK